MARAGPNTSRTAFQLHFNKEWYKIVLQNFPKLWLSTRMQSPMYYIIFWSLSEAGLASTLTPRILRCHGQIMWKGGLSLNARNQIDIYIYLFAVLFAIRRDQLLYLRKQCKFLCCTLSMLAKKLQSQMQLNIWEWTTPAKQAEKLSYGKTFRKVALTRNQLGNSPSMEKHRQESS